MSNSKNMSLGHNLKSLSAGIALTAATILPQTIFSQNTVKGTQEKIQTEIISAFKDTIISPEQMSPALESMTQKQIQTYTTRLINQYRYYYSQQSFDTINLAELKANDTLNKTAYQYAKYLYDTKWHEQQYNCHIDKEGRKPRDRVYANGMKNITVDECLAWDCENFEFVKAWIDSRGHEYALRKDDGKKIGVGYYKGIVVLMISN